MAGNGKNGSMGYPLATVMALLSMAVGAVTTFYTTRDQAMAGARSEIQASALAMRAEYRDALTHYLSREEWSQWKEANGARRDEQYYSLLGALQRISARLQK